MALESSSPSPKTKWIFGSILIIAAIIVIAVSVPGDRNNNGDDSKTAPRKHDTSGEGNSQDQEVSVKREACRQHRIDKKSCYICAPSLREKERLWCREHDAYENRCWVCHPDLRDENRAYCKEHKLYEDECIFCNPGLKGNSQDHGVSVNKEACKQHQIDKKSCYICDPSLRENERLWCREHDAYENRCWVCHPDLRDENRAYCKEHKLYEDECIFCNPGLLGKVININLKIPPQSSLFCNEHRVAELVCGICQPQRAATLEPGQSLKIRFVSKLSIFKAGIETAKPSLISSSPTIEVFSQVRYNQNAFAHITPLATGVIRRVLVDVGQDVNKDDALLEINSAEIAEAKAAYLAAIVVHRVKEITKNREETLVREKISATREYEDAKANCDIAFLARKTTRQKLLNYGFTGEEIKKIKETQDSSSLYTVRAPFDGTVVMREAVLGEAAEPGQVLFALADLTTLWLELSIPARQVAFIEKGLDVEAAFDSLPGVEVKGKLTWVSTSIDDRSRMLKARATVPNERGVLKSGMFGKAQIIIETTAENLRVPKGAVQRLQGNPYLFVKEDDDLYALRRIILGNENDLGIDVIAGIRANDQVVVRGTFTVMSELFKSRLGAGCVDE